MEAIANAQTRAEADAAHKKYVTELRLGNEKVWRVAKCLTYLILVGAAVCGFLMVGVVQTAPAACSVPQNNSTAQYDTWRSVSNSISIAYVSLFCGAAFPLLALGIPTFMDEEDEANNKLNEVRRRIAEAEVQRLQRV